MPLEMFWYEQCSGRWTAYAVDGQGKIVLEGDGDTLADALQDIDLQARAIRPCTCGSSLPWAQCPGDWEFGWAYCG